MSTEKKYYFLIPEKVMDSFPLLNSSMSYIPGYSTDNIKQVITIICFRLRKAEEGFWTPLKVSYLRKYVPHAESYLEELIILGVIERSSHYEKGKICYSYRISTNYRSRYIRFPINNPKVRRRIDKVQPLLSKHNSKKYPNQNVFIRQLSIDPEAFDYIQTNYTYDTDQFNYAYASATRIETHDFYYSIDDTSHRYHSNMTNMPKSLRQFVNINGVHLVNVDVKNSQPYISTLLLTNPEKIAEFAKYPPLARLLRNLPVKQTEDIDRYISLVVEGGLYEYLIGEFEKRGYDFKTDDYSVKRDKVKRQVLIILFNRNTACSRSREIFRELFPEVDRIFSIVRGYEKGDKFMNYKRFAILLQTVESHIILNIILARITAEYKGTIAVTIHDSIMTSMYPDHVRDVKRVMEEELSKFIGYRPTLRIE